MICARNCAPSNARRAKSQRYRADKPTTTIAASATIAIRSRVLRDIWTRLRSGFRFRRVPVLFKLVEQSLQADAQDFRGSCLVVLGMLQRDLDQGLFGLAHSGAD